MAKSTIKSYIEAGAQYTEMPRQQAEALVKSLVKSGDVRRRDAEQLLQTMLSRGRETTDRMSTAVQAEVAKQVKALSERFDEIETRLELLAASIKSGFTGDHSTPPAASASTERTAAAGEPAEPTSPKPAAKKSGTEKSTTKKSTTNKSTTKKSTTKKSTGKKSATKKSTGKKSAATQAGSDSDAVGSSGVRKVSTTRPSNSTE